jgi:hypothetical protein
MLPLPPERGYILFVVVPSTYKTDHHEITENIVESVITCP